MRKNCIRIIQQSTCGKANEKKLKKGANKFAAPHPVLLGKLQKENSTNAFTINAVIGGDGDEIGAIGRCLK